MLLPLLIGGVFILGLSTLAPPPKDDKGPKKPGDEPKGLPPQDEDTSRALWDVFCSQSEGRGIIPARRTLAKAGLTVLAPQGDWPPSRRASADAKATWDSAMALARVFRQQARQQNTTCPLFPTDVPTVEPGVEPEDGPEVDEPTVDDGPTAETIPYRGYIIELEPGGAGFVWSVYDNRMMRLISGSKSTRAEAIGEGEGYIDSLLDVDEPIVEPEDGPEVDGPEVDEPAELSASERVALLQSLTRSTPTPGFFYQVTSQDGGGMSSVANRALGANETGAQRRRYIQCIAANPINIATGASNPGAEGDTYAGQGPDGNWYNPGGFSPRYEDAAQAVAEGRWWSTGGGRFALLFLPPVELAGSAVICESTFVPPELADQLGDPLP